MPSKKSPLTQVAKLKEQRAKLRALGLITIKRDLRSKINKTDKKAVAEFQDVLAGRAKVIDVPTKAEAKKFGRIFKVKGEHVIVPRRKGERLRYNKETGNIEGKRIEYGRTRKTIIPSEPTSAELAKKGKRLRYVLPVARGDEVQRYSFMSFAELEHFVTQDTEFRGAYAGGGWKRYVEFEEVGARVRKSKRAKRRRGKC